MRIFTVILGLLSLQLGLLAAVPVTLTIGVSDPLCRKSACSCISANAVRSYDGLEKYIFERTGIRLVFSYYEEPLLMQQAIVQGKLDGMICKTWTGMLYGKESKRTFVRIADILKSKDDKQLNGIFIVLQNSPIKTIADLNGKKVVLGQKNDYEKHYLAFKTLAQHKITIAVDSPQLFSCKEAALALLEHRVDAAVISNYAFDFGCIVVVGDPKDFRVIGETDDQIPFTSLFLDQKTDSAIGARLKTALLTITGANVPADLFSKGWIAPMSWAPEELGLNQP